LRIDNPTFASANESDSKEPRYVIEISFDSANTDLLYLTSHSDTETPAGAIGAGIVIENVIEGFSGQSQEINPDRGNSTIGGFTFNLVDVGAQLTTYQRDKLSFGRGLRHKQIAAYVGFEGHAWDDYQKILTYIIDSVDYLDGVYTFTCSDIQRQARKSIFEPEVTFLSASVGPDDLLIPVSVNDLTKFPTVEHDASYSERPNQTVSYVRIENEVICHSGLVNDVTLGPSFQVIQRGALNTKASEHVLKENTSADRQEKITEHIYIEGPAAKIIYAILTGFLSGQSATLPDNWHLGIKPQYVRLSDFENIGDDLWNVTNASGRSVRFEGYKKTDGKLFIEREILLWLGCFMPVYSDGSLGLKRLTNVLSDSGYLVELNFLNVINYGRLKHDYSRVINQIDIEWNYNFNKDDFTKNSILIDAESLAIHQEAPKKTFKFRGVHTGKHTDEDILNHFDSMRDRFSGPPLAIEVEVSSSLNRLEVGDNVRLTLDQVRDFTGANINLSRTFEVQRVQTNWITGDVKLRLFGSSQRAGTLQRTSLSNVLQDSFYPVGIELSTVLNIVSGVVTLDGALNGNALLSNAIYYYEANLEIASGVTVTINQNVQLRIRGFLTVNGKIDGKGGGLLGGAGGSLFADNGLDSITVNLVSGTELAALDNASPGISGYLGSAKSSGNLYAAGNVDFLTSRRFGIVTEGKLQSIPNYNLENKLTDVSGLPVDLRGTSGPGGRLLSRRDGGLTLGHPLYVVGNGGNGGNGGAGLLIICRGMAFGASGTIDTSGGDGLLGGGAVVRSKQLYASSGAGGAPGGLVVLLDGLSTPPELFTGHIALQGESPINGATVYDARITSAQMAAQGISALTVHQSHLGFSSFDWFDAAYGLQYIPESSSIDEETGPKPPPVSGFTSEISGENALLKWDSIITSELSHFELRSGTVWATANPIAEVRLNYFNITLLTPGTYNYLIKAVFYSGQKSETAALTTLDATSFIPTTPGADITGDNISLGIINQGALATADTVDYGTQVGGAERPDNNATKNTMYYQATEPAGTLDDLWYNTSNYLFYRHNGTGWVIVSNNYTSSSQLADGAGWSNTANWSQVVNNNGARPANYATYNPGSFANLIGRITYTNMGSYFDPAAIDETYIKEITAGTINVANLSAINAILGNVTAGIITASSFSTAFSGKRVDINVSNTNEVRVYDGVNTLRGSFGYNSLPGAGDFAIGYFVGDSSSYGVYATSTGNLAAIYATTTSNQIAIKCEVSTAVGLFSLVSSSGIGVLAQTTNSAGIPFDASPTSSGRAHIRLSSNVTYQTARQGSGFLRRTIQGMQYDGNTGIPRLVTPSTCFIKDVKSNNVAGGTFTSGAWQTRDLNSLVSDGFEAAFCTLSVNRFTLIQGTYIIRASAPAMYCNSHVAKLRNVSVNADTVVGSAERSATGSGAWAQTNSLIVGKFTIASSQTFEIQHRCATTRLTNGFGIAANFGVSEVYTTVEITKIA